METENLRIESGWEEIVKGLTPENVERLKLSEFIKEGWNSVEPGQEYIHNWHIDAISEHLEAAAKREINNLLITIPPRHGKSKLCSVFFPAWVWTTNPSEKFLCISYSAGLATDFSRECKDLIKSKWYQDKWGSVFDLTRDQIMHFENNSRGYRKCTSIGGTITGLGAAIIIIDDPHNIEEAPSKIIREGVINWWSGSLITRVNPSTTRNEVKIVIMQRCHEMDLAGHILHSASEHFDHLCLPAEYDAKRIMTVSSIDWKDPREVDGELLWPKVFNREKLNYYRKEQGSYAYGAQFLQSPAPPIGGIVHRDWWRFYDSTRPGSGGNMCITADSKERFVDEIIQSWDMTFKATNDTDYVVGQVWGRSGADKFLLDQIRKRLNLPDTKKALRDMTNKWPETSAILVEEAANGAGVIQELQREISGLIPINPQGDKVGRLQAISAQVESGNVFLPRKAYWVDDYIEEFAAATPAGGGRFWDQIDATSQALLRLGKIRRKLTWGRDSDKESNKNESSLGPKRKITFGRRRITVVGEKRKRAYRF